MNIQFVAKLLLVSVFLISGIKTIFNINGFANLVASKNIPIPYFIALCILVLKIVASLLILTNNYTRQASLALILFTIMATVIFHNIFIDASQMNNFLKNTSIIGGLLLII